MKRYWKIITLCIITAIVIGAFYIQSGLAAEETKVEFQKVSGNEKEMENLVLHAGYTVGNMHQSLQITNKETFNLENQSPLQELTRIGTVPVLRELIEQHKNFMRGKELMPDNFYEDENLLAYANIKGDNFSGSGRNPSFDIEVLNKESGETTSIQLDLPNEENNSWTDVVEVQITDGELKVFTREFQADSGGKDELYLYTFDIAEQKFLNKEVILTAPAVEHGWSDVRIINDFYSIKQEKYLLVKTEAYEEENVQGEGEMEGEPNMNMVANEVQLYHVENDQLETLTIPDEMQDAIHSAAIFDSTVFVPSQSADGIEVSQYDIENKEWGQKQTFDVLHSDSGEEAPLVKLMNGKIYVIHSTKTGPSLFIGDLKTGESLYEGRLKVNSQRADQNDARLNIHEIQHVQ